MNQKNLPKSGGVFYFLPRFCLVLEGGQSLSSSCNTCMHFLTSASMRRGLGGEPLYERKEYLIVS